MWLADLPDAILPLWHVAQLAFACMWSIRRISFQVVV
jgi:hypothetical protein